MSKIRSALPFIFLFVLTALVLDLGNPLFDKPAAKNHTGIAQQIHVYRLQGNDHTPHPQKRRSITCNPGERSP